MIKNFVLFFMISALALAIGNADAFADSVPLLEAVNWLEDESHRLIRASRRTMKDGTSAFPPQVGIGYEAFWLRDYVYTLEGSIDSYTDKELLDAGKVFISSMRADGAGVDCVKFDGHPIYKPGFGTLGANPVADGSQFTVAVIWHIYKKTGDLKFLKENIDALPCGQFSFGVLFIFYLFIALPLLYILPVQKAGKVFSFYIHCLDLLLI